MAGEGGGGMLSVRKCVAVVHSKWETVSAWSSNSGTCPPDKHDGGY